VQKLVPGGLKKKNGPRNCFFDAQSVELYPQKVSRETIKRGPKPDFGHLGGEKSEDDAQNILGPRYFLSPKITNGPRKEFSPPKVNLGHDFF